MAKQKAVKPKRAYVRKVAPVVNQEIPKLETPVTAEPICKGCGHKKEKHYGSIDSWCNMPGCLCLGMK